MASDHTFGRGPALLRVDQEGHVAETVGRQRDHLGPTGDAAQARTAWARLNSTRARSPADGEITRPITDARRRPAVIGQTLPLSRSTAGARCR